MQTASGKERAFYESAANETAGQPLSVAVCHNIYGQLHHSYQLWRDRFRNGIRYADIEKSNLYGAYRELYHVWHRSNYQWNIRGSILSEKTGFLRTAYYFVHESSASGVPNALSNAGRLVCQWAGAGFFVASVSGPYDNVAVAKALEQSDGQGCLRKLCRHDYCIPAFSAADLSV